MDKKTRIKIFEEIRDIPYGIICNEDQKEMIKLNKGHCVPKHILLAEILREMEIKTKFVVCSFRWSEVKQLPKELKELARKYADLRGHLAVKAFINNKWVLLDTSFDKPLEKLGFHVNEWDGFSDTKLAVEPIGRIEVLDDYSPSSILRDDDSLEFYNKLDKWLESVR